MTVPPIRDADPTTIGYETVTRWWIVPVNTDNYTVTVAPNAAVAKWNAETAYLHDYGEWPKHIGPPRPARTDEIRTYAATIRKRRDDHLRNPASLTPPTDHSLALLELIDSQPSGAPQPSTPLPPQQAPPPPPLFDRAYVAGTLKDLGQVALWVLGITAPLVAGLVYLDVRFGLGLTAYMVNHWWWIAAELWVLLLLITTAPWAEHRIVHRPAHFSGLGRETHTGARR